MSSFDDQSVANIYRSHGSILNYILSNDSDIKESVKKLAAHWLGCAEFIERELEKDDPSV